MRASAKTGHSSRRKIFNGANSLYRHIFRRRPTLTNALRRDRISTPDFYNEVAKGNRSPS
jgi:hypothetical protein